MNQLLDIFRRNRKDYIELMSMLKPRTKSKVHDSSKILEQTTKFLKGNDIEEFKNLKEQEKKEKKEKPNNDEK